MNNRSLLLFLAVVSCLFTSCVAKSKLLFAEDMANRLRSDSAQMMNRIGQLDTHIRTLDQKITDLESSRRSLQTQLDDTRQQLDQTRRVASGEKSKSEEQIAEQQKRLEQLQNLIEEQRRNREQLRKQISDALVNFKSNELTVAIKNGKVYVSLQENLLFPSGSAVVNPKGKEALGTLAAVLNQNPDINVLIEGHTDSIPMKGKYSDNWELSVERSTAIVRILTDTYKVEPTRVTASGRSKYEPIDDNSTAEGRAKNRRTEIILEPKLNELMRLIQSE